MQFNYYTLKRLSKELSHFLTNAIWEEAFSQQKDELIIVLKSNEGTSFFIRCTLTNEFNCLSFPKEFRKSRKNVVSLFSSLEGQKIKYIEQYENERAFAFVFQNGELLLFKLFGNRSNIILFQPNQSPLLFKSKLVADKHIIPNDLHRPIDRETNLFLNNPDLSFFYPTFGKILKRHLYESNYDEASNDAKWEQLTNLERSLDQNPFLLIETSDKPILSLAPLKGLTTSDLGTSAIESLNRFYSHYVKIYYLEDGKRKAISSLKQRIKKSENYIAKTKTKLESLANNIPPNQIADIIMANLHVYQKGIEVATLLNFYSGEPMEIKIKKNSTPQKYAESLYRKSKNRKIEIDRLDQNLAKKEQELFSLRLMIEEIEALNSMKELRKLLKDESQVIQRSEVNKPYKEFDFNGWKIWVGKNAKSNDELTLKHTYKEDLWLHVKDIPGSHVVIKYRSDKGFSDRVIEKGAQIAAYYSKKKNDSHVPVIYTPAKYVRKRKGSLAGQVVVEREQVTLVTPTLDLNL